MPVKRITDHETEGKCYYSGRSKTLMIAIPKRFAFLTELDDGDTIRMRYNKDGTLTIRKVIKQIV